MYFIPFDEPFRPVMVDTTLLKEFQCASAKLLEYDAPHCEVEGLPAWRVTHGRAVLVAFLKSLKHHEFILPKGVDFHEAMKMLDFEGVGVPDHPVVLEHRIGGVGVQALETAPTERLNRTCAAISHALLQWPRLSDALERVGVGGEASSASSSTRCWVRFAEKPKMERYGGDEMYWMAKNRPRWLQATLAAIGFLHHGMVERGEFASDERTETAFSKLHGQGVEVDNTIHFMSCKRDRSNRLERERTSKPAEAHCVASRHAHRFATEVIQTVVEHGKSKVQVAPPPIPERVMYARASVSAAHKLVSKTPHCAHLFSGDFADDRDAKGLTPERRALEHALKPRGVAVVQWKSSDELRGRKIEPLIFPPSYMTPLLERSDGPCALLDFVGAFGQ